MSKYGLTRVRFEGDKTIIVAGSVPEHIAAQAVEQEPLQDPQRPSRPPVPPKAPPRFVAPAKPESQPAPAVKEGK